MFARCKPNKLIADALGIPETTVKVHLSRIFEKLGAHKTGPPPSIVVW